MATEPDFSIKAHDRLPGIRAQLMTDEDVPQPIDLSTATAVKFIMRPEAGGVPTVNAAASILQPLTGVVQYDWLAVDTSTPGIYHGEWEVTWSNLKKQTFPTTTYHLIEILADLDGA